MKRFFILFALLAATGCGRSMYLPATAHVKSLDLTDSYLLDGKDVQWLVLKDGTTIKYQKDKPLNFLKSL